MKEKMKKRKRWTRLLALCGLILGGIVWNTASANVNLDDKNFPDAGFRAYLIQNYDANKDNVLSTEEMKGITRITISKRNIKDLKGVELLTNLQVLECDDNALSSLDVSKNKELAYLDCGGNSLSVLDVSENAKLETLICYSNGMKEIKLGNIKNLAELDCSNNRLYTIQLGEQVNVAKLNLTGNQLLSLDVSKNVNLEELVCSRNSILTLNLNSNTKLRRLTCNRNGLTSLTLPDTNTLTYINGNENRLSVLDVSKNTGLRTLNIDGNQIADLQLSNAGKLEVLNCANNKLAALDVSANTELLTLDCRNNQLGFLNLDDNTALSSVKASGNKRDVYVSGEERVIDTSNFMGFQKNKASNYVNMRDLTVGQEEGSLEGDAGLAAITDGVMTFSYAMAEGFSETFQWNPVTSKQVSLFQTGVTMTVGEQLKLATELLGGEGEVTFASSDSSVVKVEGDGTLSALKAGEATITASANGYNSVSCKVTVMASIKQLTISDIPMQILVDGEAKPAVTVTCNDKTLTSGVDYDVTYVGNNKVGTATAIITGKGYYAFEVIKEFQICYDISKTVADELTEQAYTGKEIVPQVIIRNGSVILKQDADYTIQYSNNVNPGTAIITIKGIGEYTGEKLMTFNIKIPQVENLIKTGNKLAKITLTWNKVENVDGYRIYKYNPTTKKYARLATVKGNGVTTYTDTKLVSGTTYRYRVRAMVNINGTNVFGAYSKIIKTACKLVKPTLTVTSGKAGTRQANLKWNKITGSNGYRVYIKEGKTGSYKLVKSLAKAGTKKYTVASLKKGKVYYLKVRALKKVNGVNIFGAYSKEKKVTIK